MAYDNRNTGILGRNDRKETDTHPDVTGTLDVDGKAYWLSGWRKTSKDGRTFYSLSVKPKDGKPPQSSKRSAPPSDFSDLDF